MRHLTLLHWPISSSHLLTFLCMLPPPQISYELWQRRRPLPCDSYPPPSSPNLASFMWRWFSDHVASGGVHCPPLSKGHLAHVLISNDRIKGSTADWRLHRFVAAVAMTCRCCIPTHSMIPPHYCRECRNILLYSTELLLFGSTTQRDHLPRLHSSNLLVRVF